MPKQHPSLLSLFRSFSHADALGGIMNEGYAPCSLPAALGHVPLAHVCMADCIKHKQLYLIGLYPALIITNSQSLWTTLCHSAEQTWKKPLVCNSVNRDERGKWWWCHSHEDNFTYRVHIYHCCNSDSYYCILLAVLAEGNGVMGLFITFAV